MTIPIDSVANLLMRHRTPDQILGPFFPIGRSHVEQCGLTVVEGADGIAQGEIVEVTGRILNRKGDPVSGAGLTIWQANTFGRYMHPNHRWIRTLSAAQTFDCKTTASIESKR